jgi:hypothetical protein
MKDCLTEFARPILDRLFRWRLRADQGLRPPTREVQAMSDAVT